MHYYDSALEEEEEEGLTHCTGRTANHPLGSIPDWLFERRSRSYSSKSFKAWMAEKAEPH